MGDHVFGKLVFEVEGFLAEGANVFESLVVNVAQMLLEFVAVTEDFAANVTHDFLRLLGFGRRQMVRRQMELQVGGEEASLAAHRAQLALRRLGLVRTVLLDQMILQLIRRNNFQALDAAAAAGVGVKLVKVRVQVSLGDLLLTDGALDSLVQLELALVSLHVHFEAVQFEDVATDSALDLAGNRLHGVLVPSLPPLFPLARALRLVVQEGSVGVFLG